MKLRKKDFKVPIFFFVPPWALRISSSGNEIFQRWKLFGDLRNSLIFATFAVDIGTKPSFIIRTL